MEKQDLNLPCQRSARVGPSSNTVSIDDSHFQDFPLCFRKTGERKGRDKATQNPQHCRQLPEAQTRACHAGHTCCHCELMHPSAQPGTPHPKLRAPSDPDYRRRQEASGQGSAKILVDSAYGYQPQGASVKACHLAKLLLLPIKLVVLGLQHKSLLTPGPLLDRSCVYSPSLPESEHSPTCRHSSWHDPGDVFILGHIFKVVSRPSRKGLAAPRPARLPSSSTDRLTTLEATPKQSHNPEETTKGTRWHGGSAWAHNLFQEKQER